MALRRVAWVVFVVVLLVSAADVLLFTRTYTLQGHGSWDNNSVWAGLAFALTMLTFPVAGVLIATRRTGSPIGWLLLAIGVGWAIANSPYADYGLRLHPGSLPAADYVGIVSSVAWAPTIGITGTFLFLLFPDGRLPGPRWRYAGYASVTGMVVGTASLLVTPGPMSDAGYPNTENPLGVSALHTVADAGQATLVLVPIAMVAAAASLIVRFRRATVTERQQIKWLAATAAVMTAIYVVVLPLPLVASSDAEWLQTAQLVALLSFGLIPAAIGIAVLRYGLYAIDVIIRKTLVYAALIVSLALLYVGGVYAIEGAVRTISGQSGTLAVTVSTLVVAVAFQPFRFRIQRAVDRRFYRARYDAGRTLETFSSRMRDQVDLETLSDEVLEVVQGALHPSHATLWLRSTGNERI